MSVKVKIKHLKPGTVYNAGPRPMISVPVGMRPGAIV